MGPTSPDVSLAHRDAFYAAALAGLRALDARERSPRRFGADADTQWAQLKGNLTNADRVDLLLRDAAVTCGSAFSPAEVFSLFGLTPDDDQSIEAGALVEDLKRASEVVGPFEVRVGGGGFRPSGATPGGGR